jgi:hypothetical protein
MYANKWKASATSKLYVGETFSRITRLVCYPAHAAGTEDGLPNYVETVADRTGIRTAGLPSEFVSVSGMCS